jgi:hypothetical protein
LPAHSVWGGVCSVSGAQSGNQSGIQRHKDCDKPDLPGGRSPGYWKSLLTSSGNVHGVFEEVSNSGGQNRAHNDSVQACYISAVTNVAQANDMDIPDEFITSDFTKNIYDSLMDEGHLDFNMAGLWLNVYYGLSSTGTAIYPTGAASANAVVQRLVAYIIMEDRNGTPVYPSPEGDNVFFNFVDGTTKYKITSCHTNPYVAPAE